MSLTAEKTYKPRTIKQIDEEIIKLKGELEEVTGQKCEVYTRIVGYYRSLKNWNDAKKAEYSDRKEYVIKNENM